MLLSTFLIFCVLRSASSQNETNFSSDVQLQEVDDLPEVLPAPAADAHLHNPDNHSNGYQDGTAASSVGPSEPITTPFPTTSVNDLTLSQGSNNVSSTKNEFSNSTEVPQDSEFSTEGNSYSSAAVFVENKTSIHRSDDLSPKHHKVKKKVLVRPKQNAEKLILLADKVDTNFTTIDEENKDLNVSETSTNRNHLTTESVQVSSSRAQERSFKFPTTETYDIKLTTSSFVYSSIPKVVNDNLLNVIDTSIRPIVQKTTDALLTPTRNKIHFTNDYYGPTGQTDWVPLVSEQVSKEWSPVETFSEVPSKPKPSVSPLPIKFEDAVVSTTFKPIRTPTSPSSRFTVRSTGAPSSAAPKNEILVGSMIANTTSEESWLPTGSATWALMSSLFTRPATSTEPSKKPLKDNALQRDTVTEIASSSDSSENFTKDHNQVLKNTIPDILGETTPSVPKRRTTVYVPTTTTTSTTSIDDFTDVERTVSYEILKTTTLVPTRKIDVFTTEANRLKLESTTETTHIENATEANVEPSHSPSKETSSSNDVTGEDVSLSQEIYETTTSSPPSVITFTTQVSSTKIVTSEATRRPSTRPSSVRSTAIPIMTTSEQSRIPSTPSLSSEETTTSERPTSPKYVSAIVPEITTSRTDLPTTLETEAATIYPTEGITSQDVPEKTEDDNRTILNVTESTEIATPSINEFITEESVPAYLRLTVQTSEIELCERLPELREAIINMLSVGTETNVSSNCLVLLNLNHHICNTVLANRSPEDEVVRLRPVNMFLMDEEGHFHKNLSEAFLSLWGHAGLDFHLPILKVDFVTPIIVDDGMVDGMGSGIVAAIVISCVSAVCLILLAILFVIMKRRQKKFNYGQRCTPVSLDAYSLDSVSIRNSGRRKGIRASKRSYGNAGYDDPEVPSHPMNFAGLANLSDKKEELFEEFSIMPQVAPRAEEYPPGVETKNRYANVIPLPETRVILSTIENQPLSDYINANYVMGLNGVEKTYIAAQAPMETTLPDWWRMIWECQVKVILMLTALEENGVERCADYLPPNEVTDSLRLFGDYQITLKKRDVKEKYIVSKLQIKNLETNLWREVTHLWYVGWPDSGVPSESNSLIAFLIEARSEMKSTNGVLSPTLVHCSPGTGRTCTVIACDLCIREFEQKRLVDIPRCVYKLRKQRAGAVQTRDQYVLIYQVLNTYATKLTGGALDNI